MEQETLDIIEKVANNLAGKYKIAYYDADDIKQEIFIWCLEALDKYDGKRPLENFLMVHARNRCILLKRSFNERKDLKDSTNVKALEARKSKKNLLSPISIDEIDPTDEPSMCNHDDNIADKELWSIIDSEIPLHIRKDYLKFKSGVKISSCKMKKLKEIVQEILKERLGL